MSIFKIALNADGDFCASVEAADHSEAIELWANWYYRETGRGIPSECWVEQFPGVWQSFSLTAGETS